MGNTRPKDTEPDSDIENDRDIENGKGPICRPFIKWVGGKTQLLPELRKRLPARFNRYFEPFLGGGALFFDRRPPEAFLSDLNPELINAYLMVRDHVEALIADLRKHRYESDYYYAVRNADRLPAFDQWTAVERASRLIFLNKSCFNGLYRVNSKGHFNTPFGRYTNPTILDADNLRACSRVLKSAEISRQTFDALEDTVRAGDFVYFDPPYVPLSATANFTSYSKEGFDIEMQERLQQLCCRLDRKGVRFMLSNSSAPPVLELYQQFTVELVGAGRAVNSDASKRGRVLEVIVTNYS